MTIQYSTSLRNGFLDQLDSIPGSYQTLIIFDGAIPANPAAAVTGNVLIQFDLQQPSWLPASGGSKSLADITVVSTAVAAGTASHWRLYDGISSTCHVQGTLTATGGGGDMTADNTSIESGQTINLTQFTFAAPGA